MLAAVEQDGRALQYASAELRSDRKFVLAAVKQDGRALEYASAELRSDREIVLAAVEQDGHGLTAFAANDAEFTRCCALCRMLTTRIPPSRNIETSE